MECPVLAFVRKREKINRHMVFQSFKVQFSEPHYFGFLVCRQMIETRWLQEKKHCIVSIMDIFAIFRRFTQLSIKLVAKLKSNYFTKCRQSSWLATILPLFLLSRYYNLQFVRIIPLNLQLNSQSYGAANAPTPIHQFYCQLYFTIMTVHMKY